MSTERQPLRALLFDLDGTLVDSAPDLACAANAMRTVRGLQPLPLAQLRPMVGSGARGMLAVAFALSPDDAEFEALKTEFLDRYAQALAVRTRVFGHVEPLLSACERAGLPWGVVTNKHSRFTQPLLAALGLDRRAACVISGDTTPHAKPHPEPLLEAARRLGVAAQECVYVGDDLRDMQAAVAAGMPGLVALWGYLGAAADVRTWPCAAQFEDGQALQRWVSANAGLVG